MSFILDALRKSEHERQRSATPGLSQVPLATPDPQLPRWAIAVIGALAGVVLVISAAWWLSTRDPSAPAESLRTVERSVELPPPQTPAPRQAAPIRLSPPLSASLDSSLERAAGGEDELAASGTAGAVAPAPSAQLGLPVDAPSLPNAAMLAAEGIALPPLRLELHAFSAQRQDRFVFINGRKYLEGERLAEGPTLVSIAPTGAVLSQSGRQFLLVQE